MSNTLQTLKGFRDFLPNKMIIRQKVVNIFKTTFEEFGFQPLETPTIEYASTLLGKYGDEADKLVYTFKDKGDRDVGLIYDLTVPTSKVLALYQNELTLPFKRYQIQRVWRAEKPQKGRYREIMQCDVDIFGSSSAIADAEIIAVIYTILTKLNFEKFTIKINSRQVLYAILNEAGILDSSVQSSVLQSIDKLDKKSKEDVIEELKSKHIHDDQIQKIFDLLEKAEPDENLQKVIRIAEELGVPKRTENSSGIQFTPNMVRGLNYYTGTIFETTVDAPKIGSITGGGRYDHLVKTLGGPDITGVGTTIGLDRICDVIEELQIMKAVASTTKTLVAVFKGYEKNSFSLIRFLRDNHIPAEIYLKDESIGRQITYANKKGIPYVIIIGPEEVEKNIVTLKNMKTGEQKGLNQTDLLQTLLV